MNANLPEQISALLDNELDAAETEHLVNSIYEDEELLREWELQVLSKSIELGECSRSHFLSVMQAETPWALNSQDAAGAPSARKAKSSRKWQWYGLKWGDLLGGRRLAFAGGFAAVFIGIFIGYLIQLPSVGPTVTQQTVAQNPSPSLQQENVSSAENSELTQSSNFSLDASTQLSKVVAFDDTTRWHFHNDNQANDLEGILNKSLLAHSMFASTIGSNNAFSRLVSYDYK